MVESFIIIFGIIIILHTSKKFMKNEFEADWKQPAALFAAMISFVYIVCFLISIHSIEVIEEVNVDHKIMKGQMIFEVDENLEFVNKKEFQGFFIIRANTMWKERKLLALKKDDEYFLIEDLDE